jgi:hypothetical protein
VTDEVGPVELGTATDEERTEAEERMTPECPRANIQVVRGT